MRNKEHNIKGDAAKTLLLDHKLYAANTFPIGEDILEKKHFDPGVIHESKDDWTKSWIKPEMKQTRHEVLDCSKKKNK